MPLRRQAKTFTKAQVSGILGHLDRTRHPARNRVIFLLSAKAGLRAKEIASLTWEMLTDADGTVGRTIRLEDRASKGRSGRVIPMNQSPTDRPGRLEVRPGPRQNIRARRLNGAVRPDQSPGHCELVLAVVPRSRVPGLFQPQRPANLHHERRAQDLDGRRIPPRRPNTRRPCQHQDDTALHRSRRSGPMADRRPGLVRRTHLTTRNIKFRGPRRMLTKPCEATPASKPRAAPTSAALSMFKRVRMVR